MDISVTNVLLDLGAGRRGTDMGPSAMHVAGLVPRLKALGHEIPDVDTIQVRTQEQSQHLDPSARFLREITATCTAEGIAPLYPLVSPAR